MRTRLVFEHILTPGGLRGPHAIEIDEAGVIVAMRPTDEARRDGWLALPGMPNAHSHAFQRALVGQGEEGGGEDTFWSWRAAMYGLAGRIEPEQFYVVARQAFSEMLRAGFTSVAEFHYLHHTRAGTPGPDMGRALIEAARDAGIRMRPMPVFYAASGFGADGRGAAPLSEQRRFVCADVERYGSLLELFAAAAPGVAAHSLRAVPPHLLQPLLDVAVEVLGSEFPVHIHVSEQPREVSECIERFGIPPVVLLADRVVLDARWSLVHATHADPKERRLIRESGATVVLCPLTEAYLADGVFPAADYRADGGVFAIGSDSNVRIDVFEELRLLEYGQRLTSGKRARLADRRGLGAALWGACAEAGARALALPLGAIQVGCAADLVVLHEDSEVTAGVAPERVLDAMVTAGDGRSIESVYVGGVRRVESGGLTGASEQRRAFAQVMGELWP